MTAQIRPNRMQVSDRFPMLGFAVKTDRPDVQAEVVLAAEVELFQAENRARRTAANFYTSREHGLLSVPRGDGVFVVPPEVLARFIGQDKLFFGLATGNASQGALQVDAIPREGSPYVSLSGFTGRTLRRSFTPSRANSPPLLEWSGDVAQPGSEPARTSPPVGAEQRRPAPTQPPADYDDGFGDLPELPARAAAASGFSNSQQENDTMDDWQFEPAPEPQQIGAEPLAQAQALPAWLVPIMTGASSGIATKTISSSDGDITMELDQLEKMKHPNDTPPSNPGQIRSKSVNLPNWPKAVNLIGDEISAQFKVEWQYNGLSVGNVYVTNIGTNDAVGWGLDVIVRIMNDDQLYPPNNCAAVRVQFYYRFTRSIGSDVIAIREMKIFGDGRAEWSGRYVQSSTFGIEQSATSGQSRALDGGATATIAIAAATFVIESIANNQGDISWEVDQLRGWKHPADRVPDPRGQVRDGPEIRLNDWPVAGGMIDDISAWFRIRWQYDGRSLGNVSVTNMGTNDAIGWGLHVTEQIMHDNVTHGPNNVAALRLTFHYRYTRTIGSEVIARRVVTLYGDGRYETTEDWLQASALGADQNEEKRLPAAPGPRARGMDGGNGAAANTASNARHITSAGVAAGRLVLSKIRDNRGDVTWELDQLREIKHPDEAAAQNPAPFRNGQVIRLDDWPVAGGAIDDISAWFQIEWQHNGRSLGNVSITNIGVNDAVGWGLDVQARIMDDDSGDGIAALRLIFTYRFTRSIGSDVIAERVITLHGDGTHSQTSEWIQASALGSGEPVLETAR